MLTCPSRGGGFGDRSETVLTSLSCPWISRGWRSDSIPCTSHPASAAFLLAIQKARCLLEYHDRHQIVDSGKVQCPTDWVRQLSYIILRQCNKHAGVSFSTREKSFWYQLVFSTKHSLLGFTHARSLQKRRQSQRTR